MWVAPVFAEVGCVRARPHKNWYKKNWMYNQANIKNIFVKTSSILKVGFSSDTAKRDTVETDQSRAPDGSKSLIVFKLNLNQNLVPVLPLNNSKASKRLQKNLNRLIFKFFIYSIARVPVPVAFEFDSNCGGNCIWNVGSLNGSVAMLSFVLKLAAFIQTGSFREIKQFLQLV